MTMRVTLTLSRELDTPAAIGSRRRIQAARGMACAVSVASARRGGGW